MYSCPPQRRTHIHLPQLKEKANFDVFRTSEVAKEYNDVENKPLGGETFDGGRRIR